MLEEAISILGLLIVLLPFYAQLSVYSLAYRIKKFNLPESEVKHFVSRQLPLLRWLYTKSADKFYKTEGGRKSPTIEGIMFQRFLAAAIPTAFVIATVVGFVSSILNGQSERAVLYLFYGFIFAAALYIAWSFGTQLETTKDV